MSAIKLVENLIIYKSQHIVDAKSVNHLRVLLNLKRSLGRRLCIEFSLLVEKQKVNEGESNKS